MKTKILILSLLLILLCSVNPIFSQVGIGIAPPDDSAILDVDVSSLPSDGKKGFLPPRMTEADRDLIASPATGLLIYNTSTNQLNYYNAGWEIVANAADYVDLSTNQTNIAGNKTFTGTIIPQGRLMLPMGELSYFNNAAVSVPISKYGDTGYNVGLDGMTRVHPTTVEGNFPANMLNDGFDGNYSNSSYAAPTVTATDSQLKYTGATTRLFHIALSFSFTPGGNNDIVVFAVARNGIVQDKSKVIIKGGNSSDNQSSAMHVALWLKTNDYIEFYMGLTNSTGLIKIKSFNFFAMGM